MAPGQRYVVAGGSLAGHSAIAELAALAPGAEIVWITGETHRTYSKPALSKEFMQGRNQLAELTLPEVATGEATVRVIRGKPCISLDPDARSVRLVNDETVDFDQLIVATGATARIPPVCQGVEGIHALRTLDDAVGIRAELAAQPRVLVVGGGLIGCEFAASMRTLGLDVTIVERLEQLLARPFGGALSDYFRDLHRERGVDLVMNAVVERVLCDDRVAGIVLADGTEIRADLVVVGAGSEPATQWLEGSGLALADGVVCDAFLAASHPAVHAAGDVARWHNPVFARPMRVEHWTNASAQGRAAARNAVAAATGRPDLARPFADVPYFWSDQYGQKIQMVGWHEGHDRVEIDRPDGTPGPIARFYRDGALVAAAGVNAPRAIMQMRRQIAEAAAAKPLLAEAS